MIEAFGVTDRGPVRPNNEDCFLSDAGLSLFVVADGMGGHAAGEVASRLAVDAIEAFIRESRTAGSVSWPYGLDPDLSLPGNRLRTGIHLANQRVFRASEDRDEYRGMGTTVVCALISGARLTVGHVGDSRLYRLSHGVLSAQTRDDTWAATVLGIADDALRLVADHPMRNVLTNVLGAREQTEVHLSEWVLREDEVLLLCTDGVHNVLDEEALRRLLSADGAAEALARAVVDAAIAGGSRDNATAVVIRYRP